MTGSRKLTVELNRLLDLVVAIQMDGIDTVHEFLGDMVGRLTDAELAAFVQTLAVDGYDRRDRDEADRHLRRWRERYAMRGVKAERQCRECFETYEAKAGDDGFCSDSCEQRYDRELAGEVDDPDGFQT